MNLENYKKEKKTIDLQKANLIAIIYLVVFTFIFAIPYYFLWGFNFSLKNVGNVILLAFLPFVVLILGIILHELIHGLFFSLYASRGFKSVKFGILWKMLTPYCHCKEPLQIKNYVVALLGPFILMGIIPGLISLAIGNIPLLLFGIFFSSAAAGDLMIYSLIKKEDPQDYVQDHPSEAGYYIFRKVS